MWKQDRFVKYLVMAVSWYLNHNIYYYFVTNEKHKIKSYISNNNNYNNFQSEKAGNISTPNQY